MKFLKLSSSRPLAKALFRLPCSSRLADPSSSTPPPVPADLSPSFFLPRPSFSSQSGQNYWVVYVLEIVDKQKCRVSLTRPHTHLKSQAHIHTRTHPHTQYHRRAKKIPSLHRAHSTMEDQGTACASPLRICVSLDVSTNLEWCTGMAKQKESLFFCGTIRGGTYPSHRSISSSYPE